jgi:hypothetical protein
VRVNGVDRVSARYGRPRAGRSFARRARRQTMTEKISVPSARGDRSYLCRRPTPGRHHTKEIAS